jgi:hypothetical protein
MELRLKYYYRRGRRVYFRTEDKKKISFDYNFKNNPELMQGLKRDKELILIITVN